MDCPTCGRELDPRNPRCPICAPGVSPAPPPSVAPPPPPPPPPAAGALRPPGTVEPWLPPREGPEAGAAPDQGQPVVDLRRLLAEAWNLLITDVGNFLALGVVLQVGVMLAAVVALAPVLMLLISPPAGVAGVLLAVLMLALLLPAIPFAQYAILVHKLRSGVFEWARYGQGIARYFQVLPRMIGLQLVTALPSLIYLAIVGVAVVGLYVAYRGQQVPPAAGFGAVGALALLGLVVLLAQIYWAVRLFFAGGMIIIHNRGLGEALSASLRATGPRWVDLLVLGLVITGLGMGVSTVLGILQQIPIVGALLGLAGLLVTGVWQVWYWLVIWLAYRDNYGVGDAVGLPYR